MRILEFIKQNCENVEFRALGEVCKRQKGSNITASKMKEIDKPNAPICIFAGGKTIAYADYSDIDKNSIITKPSIIVKSRGIIDFEFYNKPFTHKNELWSYSLNSNEINLKFIYYYLKNNVDYFIKKSKRGAMPQIATPDTDNFKIPVPPMVVQERIVEVLDSFSSLVRSLVRSLVLEKTAREKQYKYYLNHLITNARNSRILKLGEVCEFVRGIRVTKKDLNNGKYLVYQNSLKPLGNYDKANCSANSTFIIVGGSAGSIGYSYDDFWAADDCFYCKTNENVINRFIYYILINKQNELLSKVRKASVPRISRNDIENIEIPLPPLDEQERIIRILDSLNELANGLSAGIPKEIELRQKQYEYWRDRLLEFPSKDSK